MEATKNIFSAGLGLQDPWYVKESCLEDGIMKVSIDFIKGSKFIDKETGKSYPVYRTKTRLVKHLFMRQYQTILEIRIPEIKTDEGSIKTIDFPLMDKGSSFTYLFEAMVLELADSMPINKVASTLKEHYHTILRIVDKYVSNSKAQADYSNITGGCIDETSTKKGHNYITSFINLDTKRISSITTGKGKDTISEIIKDIELHKGNRMNINRVCIDLSPSFISGCNEFMPKATIVFDKFHIMQFVHKALDNVRKIQVGQNKGLLEKTKYLWLQNSKNLSQTKADRLRYIMSQNEALAIGYQLKEDMKELFCKPTKEEANNYLETWCERAMNTKLHPFHDVVRIFKRHREGIISYIEYNISNGIMEGINGIIQSIKNRARGYKNINNFITMIYLKLGDFKIILPT